MNIYSFYQPLEDWWPSERPLEIIDLWKKSWESWGWNPVVLGLDDARKHPLFNELDKVASQFPSACRSNIDRFAMLRWCAFAMAADNGAWFGDYDVLNYGFMPYNPGRPVTLCSRPTTFAISFAYRKQLDKFVGYFIDYKVRPSDYYDGKPHVSDMNILFDHMDDWSEEIPIEKPATAEVRWDNAALVHYAGAFRPLDQDRIQWMKQRPGYCRQNTT